MKYQIVFFLLAVPACTWGTEPIQATPVAPQSSSDAVRPAARRLLSVSATSWSSLTQQQRDSVSTQYVVEVAEHGRYAKIVHVQSINESTSGSVAGTQLGNAVGQAQYIDKSNWSNYSAKRQIGAGILGAVIGSMLDAPPQIAHRLVYTLRSSDGSVRVLEKVSQSQIYNAPGLCIDTVLFVPASDDHCENIWPVEIRAIVGAPPAAETRSTATPAGVGQLAPTPSVAQPATSPAISRDDIVYCRLGSTAVVSTTAVKCLQAGGTIQS